MDSTPESQARRNIDDPLAACGWVVQDRGQADITAANGVAIREMRTKEGDWADYVHNANGEDVGVVEAGERQRNRLRHSILKQDPSDEPASRLLERIKEAGEKEQAKTNSGPNRINARSKSRRRS